ncbi:mitochondrial outer membrane protein porin of 36 kDa-like [Prosopis cineraria]|uniref:mitochondrial outer membrane protein porin of 36 kDa-like n=1 Tax=Prosopis cineraria TaxID=364024 RepID=UPI002410A178|nr:mitochondrial outer membrane protein porin of 36 kDa-like [Prosopis cineraria]XP_054821740.1 mitochondrial outer membrane protein porin of 36 kDa-like [Prosopis cineraria]
MSKCPGLYFDIGKRAKDVLHKDYAHQPPIHFHYQFMDWNLDLSCQVEEIVPGLRSLFNFTLPDSGKVELQYLSNYTGITGCIGLIGNLERGYDPVVNFSGLIGTDILSLGTKLAYDISTREFRKMNVGFSFNTAFLVASMTMHDRFDTVKASFYHEVNPLTKTAIAAEVKHRISLNETGVTIGAQHALLPCTMVKARLDTYGKAGALIQQQFWQRICISMAGEIDFRATSKLPKIGLSLALAP